jgi:uncharacterized membrane protein YhaH (DUF805 family)
MKSIADLFFLFDGRIGRAKFWLGMLILAAVSFALVRAIIELVSISDVAVKYAALTATLLLFPLAVIAAGLWLLIDLGLLKGTQGPNRYGPDPAGRAHADAGLG